MENHTCRLGIHVNTTYSEIEDIFATNIQDFVNHRYAAALDWADTSSASPTHKDIVRRSQPFILYQESYGHLFDYCPDCGGKINWEKIIPSVNRRAKKFIKGVNHGNV